MVIDPTLIDYTKEKKNRKKGEERSNFEVQIIMTSNDQNEQ